MSTVKFNLLTNYTGQRNDCTVIALASVLDIPYIAAHDRLTAAGRGIDRGLRCDYLSTFLRDNGFILLPECRVSLERAVSLCSKGRYLVRTKNHAFTIIDGIVNDCNQPTKQKIERIYKWQS